MHRETHNLLIISWINNILENNLNDEILLLICNHDDNKNDVEKQLNEIEVLKSKNYVIIDIQNLNSINEISRSHVGRNIIILSNFPMDIDKFIDCNFILLPCLFLSLKFLLLNIKKNQELEKPNIPIDDRYMYYLEKRDPIELIKKDDYSMIKNQIFAYFDKNLSSTIKLDLFKRDIYEIEKYKHNSFMIYDLLEYDIPLLTIRRILSSQLAIVLYKSTTLRFDDSDTKIGNYYRKEFGIKTKITHLPGSRPAKKVKAYHLKTGKLNIFSSPDSLY